MQTLESLFGLSGRVALVTGGSRGIGRPIGLGLAAAGASVAVHYGSDAAAAADVVAEIEALGGRADRSRCRSLRPAAIGPLLDEVGEFAGEAGLGVLVNNAGVYPAGPFESLERRGVGSRLRAQRARAVPRHAGGAAAAAPRGEARVINIGTVMFHRGAPGALHYVASKGAVIGLTHALARELGPDGITVNCLVPSMVDTETANGTRRRVDAVVAEQVVPRYQQPDDLVGAILWLASPGSALHDRPDRHGRGR